MKNMELLNICYKFFNRFITVNELIENLSNMDKTNLDNNSKEKLNSLIIEIRKISEENPNREDELVRTKREQIQKIIDKFTKILEANEIDFIRNSLEHKKEELKKEMDCYDRWFKVIDYINENDYFNACFESLSDYELLEFITQYISAPFPPKLIQEEFDKLVKVGIEKDRRESLWRLAFNYERRDINFDAIIDYFISKKDGYYLAELISAVGENLDIDKIIDKINDKELINYLKEEKNIISKHVSEEQFNRLISKLEE